jgi:hypothetical protein
MTVVAPSPRARIVERIVSSRVVSCLRKLCGELNAKSRVVTIRVRDQRPKLRFSSKERKSVTGRKAVGGGLGGERQTTTVGVLMVGENDRPMLETVTFIYVRQMAKN